MLHAPFDVALSDDTVRQPDLIPRATSPTVTCRCLPSCVIDPIELSLTAWYLVDGRYVEVADVSVDQSYSASLPVDVEVVPARLRD